MKHIVWLFLTFLPVALLAEDHTVAGSIHPESTAETAFSQLKARYEDPSAVPPSAEELNSDKSWVPVFTCVKQTRSAAGGFLYKKSEGLLSQFKDLERMESGKKVFSAGLSLTLSETPGALGKMTVAELGLLRKDHRDRLLAVYTAKRRTLEAKLASSVIATANRSNSEILDPQDGRSSALFERQLTAGIGAPNPARKMKYFVRKLSVQGKARWVVKGVESYQPKSGDPEEVRSISYCF